MNINCAFSHVWWMVWWVAWWGKNVKLTDMGNPWLLSKKESGAPFQNKSAVKFKRLWNHRENELYYNLSSATLLLDLVIVFKEIMLVNIMMLLMMMKMIIMMLVWCFDIGNDDDDWLVWCYIFRLTGNPHPQLPKYPRMLALEKLVLKYICFRFYQVQWY